MKLPPVRLKYLITYCGVFGLIGIQTARAQQYFPDSTTALPAAAPAPAIPGVTPAPVLNTATPVADSSAPAVSPATATAPAASQADSTAPSSVSLADTTAPVSRSLMDTTGLPFSLDNPQRYVIGGVRVSGSKYLDNSLVASVTGLYKGQAITLPGDGLSDAIHKLWDQKLFSDVAILVDRIVGDSIYLNLHVTERPRLGNFHFSGVKKTAADELKDKVGLIRGTVITGNTTLSAIDKIKKYFQEKGYRNVTVVINEQPTPGLLNTVDLTFHINRGNKVKVSQIFFAGNSHVSDRKLEKQMKGTKERTRISLHASDDMNVYGAPHRVDFADYMDHFGFLSFSQTRLLLNPYFRFKFFSSAKFDNTKYQEDKDKVLSYYNTLGYRDAVLEADTVYTSPEGGVDVAMKVSEGKKYYFGNISWKGNTQYPDSILERLLGIQHGDVYNIELLNKRLGVTPSEQGGDISSLYQDNGYLFFHITPVETSIRGDTIDYEMRMVEGPQADINRITVTGNDKTNEHVVRRELRTIPGEKYSRADVIRSMRQISQLGFFDPQKVTPNIQPNPQDGTVDIGWGVEEKPSDKLNLSAGWGGYYGITGTIGMSFNNFSIRNIFNKKAWRPLPSGDGQTLSVQLQSNGKYYSSYNFSFTEPWLGGKKHNPFTISYYHNKFSNPSYEGYIPIFNDTSYLKTTGISVSYGKQLKWPDDFFSLSFQLSYERYKLRSYFNDPIFTPSGLTTGVSNNIYLRITLDRNSTDQPLFPTRGSHFTFYGQFTPPYSAFNEDKDYDHLTPQEKFRFIEYQKYRFTGQWFFPIGQPTGKDHKTFVLHLAAKMGIIGRYNPSVPLSPFERFELGGDGISNYIYYGKDIISQRGYPVYYTSDPTVNPDNQNPPSGYQGFTMFSKYTLELRYPISLNPSSTIYALTFLDAANGYNGIKDFDPFRLRRDVGIGMRFFLPMFGLLGFDYGVGLDRLRQGGGLKNATKFSFMLGYEPD
jgi:outer membrane protein insertion porin family